MLAQNKMKYITLFIALLGPISLFGQYTDCPYIIDVNGNPIVDSTFLAEHLISSEDTINAPLSIHFGAQEVDLEPSFYVDHGAIFTADSAGCVSSCIPPLSTCDEPCVSPFDDETTLSGVRFVQHEVVFSLPDSVVVDVQGVNINYSGISINVRDTMIKYMKEIIPGPPIMDTLSRCLCDENIFLYENENLIFDEGRVATSNTIKDIEEEGGTFSLNYILENLEPKSPDNIANNVVASFASKANMSPGPMPSIVAILDSGLDPSLAAPNSLFYDDKPASFVCSLTDTAGWNFIEDNHDLYDDRGHGTLVTLAYQKALQSLRPLINLENSQVLTVKVLNECGEGTIYSTVCGLKYAEKKGAQFINTSWGLYQNNFPLQRAVEEVVKSNVRIICSAGNNGLDLSAHDHFPSGYSAEHEHYVTNDSSFLHPGFGRVFEVGGACRFIDAPCMPQPVNLPLEGTSNFREILIAESSRGIKQLLPAPLRPSCEILGTSFAAPILTAGLLHYKNVYGSGTKEDIVNQSKKLHPEFKYYSYFLNHCN